MIVLETERLLFREHRGLATEAGRAFIEFGFGELALSRIVATVETDNEASLRGLRKLEFQWLRLDKGERRSFDEFELRNPGRLHQAFCEVAKDRQGG